DADYINFAFKHWGPRPEGWEANDGLRNLIFEVSQHTIECSRKMKYVPKPTLTPPGAAYFVGYIISLREKNKKIPAYEAYEACLNAVVNPRQADAYLTQSY
ncbi:hypothetical protein LXA47_19245, partial [Massilia sp. P8910]|uniref:hypothetical protein n=1 Tax=Massilia antarctica TaxID=2765360 RepID=UPI001E2DC1B2